MFACASGERIASVLLADCPATSGMEKSAAKNVKERAAGNSLASNGFLSDVIL